MRWIIIAAVTFVLAAWGVKVYLGATFAQGLLCIAVVVVFGMAIYHNNFSPANVGEKKDGDVQ